ERIQRASSGPAIAPAESIACKRPKAEPILPRSTDSDSMTSRGVPRTPFAMRSQKRMKRTCHHEVATARTGLTAFATTYPETTIGLRRGKRSARKPESSLANDATLSATPSMNPSLSGPAPSDNRNAGTTQYAISLPVSLKNEVAPKASRVIYSLRVSSCRLEAPGYRLMDLSDAL